MSTDPIKAKIQELCPEVMEKRYCVCNQTITLAVVLRAISLSLIRKMPKENKEIVVTSVGEFLWYNTDNVLAEWNLEHDNYDQQSEECKLFIGNLLGV